MTYILLESNVSVYVLFNSLLVSSFRLTSYVQINKCPIVPCLSLIIYCFAMHELLSSFANSIYIYIYIFTWCKNINNCIVPVTISKAKLSLSSEIITILRCGAKEKMLSRETISLLFSKRYYFNLYNIWFVGDA